MSAYRPVDPPDPTASPHWEWAARVQAVDAEGVLWDVADVRYGRILLSRDLTSQLRWVEAGEIRPVLGDPATDGHLLTLVRKAWAAARIEVVVFDDGRAAVRIIRDDASTVEFIDVSLGLALAASLLAAPPKGEGT